MADFGTGIYLDEQLDFVVSPTGDLKTKTGADELQKDLSYNMILNLQQYLGQPPSGNLEEKVAGTARRVAEADTRIDSVLSEQTKVTFSPDREEIELIMVIRSDDAEQELVFNV